MYACILNTRSNSHTHTHAHARTHAHTQARMHKHVRIYIYILYVYVSNQIQQNRMQPEHVSEAERFNILLCVCALRSVVHGQSKRSTLLTGKPNPAQITRSH